MNSKNNNHILYEENPMLKTKRNAAIRYEKSPISNYARTNSNRTNSTRSRNSGENFDYGNLGSSNGNNNINNRSKLNSSASPRSIPNEISYATLLKTNFPLEKNSYSEYARRSTLFGEDKSRVNKNMYERLVAKNITQEKLRDTTNNNKTEKYRRKYSTTLAESHKKKRLAREIGEYKLRELRNIKNKMNELKLAEENTRLAEENAKLKEEAVKKLFKNINLNFNNYKKNVTQINKTELFRFMNSELEKKLLTKLNNSDKNKIKRALGLI